MRFKALLGMLFPTLVAIPAKTSKTGAAAVAQNLVRSYARGNVNLQRGRYVTAEQLEARKRKLAQSSF